MRSPWQVLGLAPGSSRQAIRTAYARLLKLHRPDVDPVGFRAIRDAYEQLRNAGESPFADTDLTIVMRVPHREFQDPGERAAPTPEPEPLQQDVRPARLRFGHRMQRALERSRPDSRRFSRVLQVLIAAWRRETPWRWNLPALLQRELARGGSPLRQLLEPCDVRIAIERGESSLITALLQAHIAADDSEGTETLLTVVTATCLQVPDASRVAVLTATAREIALLHPTRAEGFADVAFRRRSAVGRTEDPELDIRIEMGKELGSRPDREKWLFTRLLFARDRASDVESLAAAVASLKQRRSIMPLVAQRFRTRFPEQWAAVEEATANPQQQVAEAGHRAHRATAQFDGGNSLEWLKWLVVLGMMSLGALGRCFATESRQSRRSWPLSAPARLEPNRERTPAQKETLREFFFPHTKPGMPPVPPSDRLRPPNENGDSKTRR